MRIARRFNAGNRAMEKRVPEGRLSTPRQASRRDFDVNNAQPGVEAPGWLCASVKTKILTGESPSTAKTYRRVAEGNCVAARRGGEQPKAKEPSQNSIPMQLNSIRPFRVTSLRSKGEVLDERRRSEGASKCVKAAGNSL